MKGFVLVSVMALLPGLTAGAQVSGEPLRLPSLPAGEGDQPDVASAISPCETRQARETGVGVHECARRLRQLIVVEVTVIRTGLRIGLAPAEYQGWIGGFVTVV